MAGSPFPTLGNHQLYLLPERSFTLKGNPEPIKQSLPIAHLFPAPGNAPSVFHRHAVSYSAHFIEIDSHHTWSCVWLLVLSPVVLRFLHDGLSIRVSYIYIYTYSFYGRGILHCPDGPRAMYVTIHRRTLEWFPPLGNREYRCCQYICTVFLLEHLCRALWGHRPQCNCLVTWSRDVQCFWDPLDGVPQWPHHFPFPPAMHEVPRPPGPCHLFPPFLKRQVTSFLPLVVP